MTEQTTEQLSAAEQAVAVAKAALAAAKKAARDEDAATRKAERAQAREAAKATRDAAKAEEDAERIAKRAERVPEGYEVNEHYSDQDRLILKYVATEPWLVVCEHGTQKPAETLGDARAAKQDRGSWCPTCKREIAKAEREAAKAAAAADAETTEQVDASATA